MSTVSALPIPHVKVHCWTDTPQRVCLEFVQEAGRVTYIRVAEREEGAFLLDKAPSCIATCTVILCNLDIPSMLRDFAVVRQRLERKEMKHSSGLGIKDNPIDSNCTQVNSASLAYALLVQGGILIAERYSNANFSGPRTRAFQDITSGKRFFWQGCVKPEDVELTATSILKFAASAADTRDQDRDATINFMQQRNVEFRNQDKETIHKLSEIREASKSGNTAEVERLAAQLNANFNTPTTRSIRISGQGVNSEESSRGSVDGPSTYTSVNEDTITQDRAEPTPTWTGQIIGAGVVVVGVIAAAVFGVTKEIKQ